MFPSQIYCPLKSWKKLSGVFVCDLDRRTTTNWEDAHFRDLNRKETSLTSLVATALTSLLDLQFPIDLCYLFSRERNVQQLFRQEKVVKLSQQA